MKSYQKLAEETLERFLAEKYIPKIGELADAYLAFAERDTETPMEVKAETYRIVAEKLEKALEDDQIEKIMTLVFPYIAARQKAEGNREGERKANIFHVTP